MHVRSYRLLLRLMPRSRRRRHGDAQVQLFIDLMSTGHNPWRVWAGAVADIWHVTLIVSETRSSVMSHIARLSLFPLSVLNAVVGRLDQRRLAGGGDEDQWRRLVVGMVGAPVACDVAGWFGRALGLDEPGRVSRIVTGCASRLHQGHRSHGHRRVGARRPGRRHGVRDCRRYVAADGRAAAQARMPAHAMSIMRWRASWSRDCCSRARQPTMSALTSAKVMSRRTARAF